MSDACWNCAAAVDLSSEVFCPRCHADLLRPVARPAREPSSVPSAEAPAAAAPAAAQGSWNCPSPGCGGHPVPVGQACPFCGATERRSALVLATLGFELALEGDGPWTLGRESADSPQLASLDTVSRIHAAIARRPGGYVVTDLNSTNGTYVDGDQLGRGTPPRELRDGAVLGLGHMVKLDVRAAS